MTARDPAELVMPFVTVVSKGGPHDDDAYSAGWEMGDLDARLRLLRQERVRVIIQTSNTPQADLIAMRHGYTGSSHETEASGWSELRLRRHDSEAIA